ncbi:nucleotidyltransferase family protein [Aestuariirhabdus sp. Z084]|uniref:nucleotidyltransferase domain-containing protein n=1 Tax=Aestuariirhabdus haliotis TaxID=2918751 RepID=UPI00201B3D5F|nr:nucleotidyltransferase family protein [Aestuariirhabdus haliotis]MCL6416779.1 nucleotidyltransferase family protein [Aestuariirhabdus haliotis]MCL6420756.1 nucleotidyltransferase family protein [Aestuariirhabdus haliotis]
MNTLLLDVLRAPSTMGALNEAQWDGLLRSAREAELTGRLQVLISTHSESLELPDFARLQLDSVAVQMQAQQRALSHEVECLERVLYPESIPHLYLKGAAYQLAGCTNAAGRLFSDLDLLVPESRIEETEQLLRDHGWVSTHTTTYDQQYYRRWMHELPPMVHVKRRTVLDLHHNILPRTAAHVPDASRLFEQATTLASGHCILSPVDRLLHSTSHLFHEGEVKQGLRGLVDVDLLYRELDKSQRENVFDRAGELHLLRPLFYGLHYGQRYLGTPLDSKAMEQLEAIAPPEWARKFMDWTYFRVFCLAAEHPVRWDERLAEWLVYLRGHHLRMPFYRLIPHLVVKGIKPLRK